MVSRRDGTRDTASRSNRARTGRARTGLGLSARLRQSIALWCAIGLLAAAGCLGIERELALLWRCWTTDPLRSIGMLIPPASIILTLRVWRQNGWELRGSWWGLVLICAAFFVSILHQSAELFFTAGSALVSLIPLTLPVYLYGSGIVLLFAGTRVWRKAWFPLALLLLSQPVPVLTSSMIDIPLQNISARVARDFATLIHFAPTTPQLRLMFSPDFGMFIAPGCDGIRGAVTLGYLALILGYLKRVSLRRWAAYVIGGVLLGYLFNFIRLCVLVIYYRIALGHPALEGVAKQADYVIGSCLFLLAILIFVLAREPEGAEPAPADVRAHDEKARARVEIAAPPMQNLFLRCAAFAAVLTRGSRSAFFGASIAAKRAGLKPSFGRVSRPLPQTNRQLRAYAHLVRTVRRTNARRKRSLFRPGSDEIILAVWVAPFVYYHDANSCWLARGLQPERVTSLPFVTAQGNSLDLSTGFYNDGVTDSIVVSVACTPGLLFAVAAGRLKGPFQLLRSQAAGQRTCRRSGASRSHHDSHRPSRA